MNFFILPLYLRVPQFFVTRDFSRAYSQWDTLAEAQDAAAKMEEDVLVVEVNGVNTYRHPVMDTSDTERRHLAVTLWRQTHPAGHRAPDLVTIKRNHCIISYLDDSLQRKEDVYTWADHNWHPLEA